MRPLAITVGDPDGVGPEVVVKALAARRSDGAPVQAVVYGDDAAMARAAGLVGVAPEWVSAGLAADGAEPIEVRAIRRAVQDVLDGRCSGLVTGPIHKARLARQGFQFPGHTDFLGHLCGVDAPVMAFVGGSVRVALVTVHLPLREVADAITLQGVLHTLRVSEVALRDQLGLARRRIAVCGLNPHAGDDGLLGGEEALVVAPAVRAAVSEGIDAVGPISAEAAFRQAVDGQVDWVVAMYHDQGLAPLKALDFGRSVNWTLGLPLVRTSVDHGTADDIAWKGIADASSMAAAIGLAEQLIARRSRLD